MALCNSPANGLMYKTQNKIQYLPRTGWPNNPAMVVFKQCILVIPTWSHQMFHLILLSFHLILFCLFNIVQEVNGTLKFILACLRCCSIFNSSLLYVHWLGKKQEKGVQGAQEEVTRPQGRANKTRLSTDPDYSQYEICGLRQRCPVHKPLANGPCSHTHLWDLWI